MSLRARLLLLVACAALVPVLVVAVLELQARRAALVQADRALHATVQRVAEDLGDAVRATLQLNYGLSRARDLDGGDRAACSGFLASALKDYPQYTGISTLGPDGQLVCDSLQTGRAFYMSDRRYFQEVATRGAPFALEAVLGRLSGKSVLLVGSAAREGGTLRFVLVSSLDLERFMQAHHRGLPFRAPVLALTDASGTVLTWHPGGDAPRRQTFDERLGGAGLIWASARPPAFPQAGLSVRLGIPKAEFSAAADRRLREMSWTAAVSALLALALAWALAETAIRRPITRIEDAVARFRAGDYAARVAAPYPRGELGVLMRELNATAERIQHMDAELRRHAEQCRSGLAEMQQRFESFMENIPMLASIRDAQGRFVYANAAWRELNGIDPAQALGRTMEELFGKEFAGTVARQDAAVLGSGAPAHFHYAQEVRGQPRIRESWRFPLRREGNDEVMIGTVTFDVTAAERAAAALRESEEKYRHLTETLRDGVYRADPRTSRAMFVNPALETLTGYPVADWLSARALWREILHPEDRSRVLGHFERAASSGEGGEVDYRIVRRDGAVRWISDRYSFEHDRAGGVSAIVGTMSDVTDRVLAMHRIAESDRAKSAFLAAMSHELKTPLTSILGFSSELLRRAQSLSEEELRDLEAIHSSGEALLAMVEDLLDLARIEGGGISLQLEPADPELLVETCVAARRDEARRKGIGLECDVPAGLGEARVDPRRFRQMLNHFLGNAIKFTPAGGRVTCRARRVAHSGRAWLEVSVSDTGPGIAPEDQAKLFRPFIQVDRALSRRHGGAGLGLAIVRGLAALHGGRAGVRSEPGQGSTFFIHVPPAEAAP